MALPTAYMSWDTGRRTQCGSLRILWTPDLLGPTTCGARRWASAGAPVRTAMLSQAGIRLHYAAILLTAAAAAHPSSTQSPLCSGRPSVGIRHFASLRLLSPPNPRLTPLGFGGDPSAPGWGNGMGVKQFFQLCGAFAYCSSCSTPWGTWLTWASSTQSPLCSGRPSVGIRHAASLRLLSPPNSRLTPLGFGGVPGQDGHAVPGRDSPPLCGNLAYCSSCSTP